MKLNGVIQINEAILDAPLSELCIIAN
jgi:hypothetical protein